MVCTPTGRKQDLHSRGKSPKYRKNTCISQFLPFSLPQSLKLDSQNAPSTSKVLNMEKNETIFTQLEGLLVICSWHMGTLPSGDLIFNIPAPLPNWTLNFEKQEPQLSELSLGI